MRETWTVQDIYRFIKELDAKTGLAIANNKVSINHALRSTYGRVIIAKCDGARWIDKIEFASKLIKYGSDEQIKECIIHEYAHCMQVVKGVKVGHNASFRRYNDQIGGTGKTYFKGNLAFAPKEEEIPNEKTLPVKYRVQCQSCQSVFSYKRKTKLIHCLMSNKAHGYQCNCGGEDFRLIENRE